MSTSNKKTDWSPFQHLQAYSDSLLGATSSISSSSSLITQQHQEEKRIKVLEEAKLVSLTDDEVAFIEKYRKLKNKKQQQAVDKLVGDFFQEVPEVIDQVNYCHGCCEDLHKKKKKNGDGGKDILGKSDIDFRNFIFRQTILEFGAFQECDKNCNLGRKCIWKLNWPEVMQNMFSYWGNPNNSDAPTRSMRAEQNDVILKKAIRKPAENDKHAIFEFRINDHIICENTYLYLTGLKMANSRVGENWLKTRLKYANPSEYASKQFIKNKKGKKKLARKFNHCVAYIRFVAEFVGEAAVGENVINIKILPYETAKELYREYYAHYNRAPQQSNTYFHDIAKESTFVKALGKLKEKEVRLRRSRGSFDTCALCNNLHDSLKSTKLRWTDTQVCMLYRYMTYQRFTYF